MNLNIKFFLKVQQIGLSTTILFLSGCGGNSDPVPNPDITNSVCSNTLDDSQDDGMNGFSLRIKSENNGFPIYYIMDTRQRSDGSVVSIDYMVHLPPGAPAPGPSKAILVLISGGNMDGAITGTGDISPVTNAGGNFLIRSAHLFARQGYTVITVDRPSDYDDDLMGSTANKDYDKYRISMRHSVDLARIVNRVKNVTHPFTEQLPLVLSGTSRGAISAVAQGRLTEAVAVSSSLTNGPEFEVGTPQADPTRINQPAHVLWHNDEACTLSPATGIKSSTALVSIFPDGSGDRVSGGFLGDPNVCGAFHYHGYFGIESCAVKKETDWIASVGFSAVRPTATMVTGTTTAGTAVNIDLTGAATGGTGVIAYKLPLAANQSSLLGSLSIGTNNVVTYTPASGIGGGVIDTFVYLAEDENDAKAFNVVEVTVN